MTELGRAIQEAKKDEAARNAFEAARLAAATRLWQLTRHVLDRKDDHDEFGRVVAMGALEAATALHGLGMDWETVDALLPERLYSKPWIWPSIEAAKTGFDRLYTGGEAAVDEATASFAKIHADLAELDGGAEHTWGAPAYFEGLAYAVRRWDGRHLGKPLSDDEWRALDAAIDLGALSSGGAVKGERIAGEALPPRDSRMPKTFAKRVLPGLVKTGLMASCRGPGGGYWVTSVGTKRARAPRSS